MMIFSSTRKRSRDVEDDFDLGSAPLGKRSRAATDNTQSFPSAATRPWAIPRSPLRISNTADMTDSDFNSTASEAGSTTDDGMDLDLAPSRTYSPQPTPLSSSWSGPSTWAPHDRPPRRADSLLSRPVRPKPYPLQSSHDPRGPSTAVRLHARNSGMSMSITPTLTTTSLERQNSPQDTDEPHTPTTVAGSQLSLLSVNDMEIDSEPSTPSIAPLSIPHRGASTPTESDSGSFIRKQRQRSGAFISSPSDAAKRFQMGYREDCEKCRDRVPGHMNHFLGA
ncbi:hypothetical protein K461DRAFT_320996 [Myriangium duriaei CBS 260.36]|uniref:Uncharacterized protein n=1 Tax=Myriangium duriaei CBS 260.36 TaxID=1168546 RepID=A0A9P4MHL1_9PEZI|nr:hypothetical protein K461DRAFT_320996 [Myriangium duriaei CBS 260.36]